ncbi:MAG: hypothetical protein ACK5BV_01030 [Bacteroidota bacterium]|jgi:hypothetical protein
MQNVQTQKIEVSGIGKHIGVENAEEMVKRFFDAHPEQAYSNVMGKEIIEKILAQPGCKGISILPGYDSNGQRHVILTGVDENFKPILNYNVINVSGSLFNEDGLVANQDFKTTIGSW